MSRRTPDRKPRDRVPSIKEEIQLYIPGAGPSYTPGLDCPHGCPPEGLPYMPTCDCWADDTQEGQP